MTPAAIQHITAGFWAAIGRTPSAGRIHWNRMTLEQQKDLRADRMRQLEAADCARHLWRRSWDALPASVRAALEREAA